LESLKATYEKTFVRSPLDGIVIRRYRNASEFADVGDPIVEVADLSDLIVEADVNEIDVGKVRTGQRVTITTDAFPGTTFSGEVYEVGAALKQRESEPQDPSVVVDQKILPIKVRFLKRAPLKLGMKVDLKISVPGASA
jgi:multidrug resistance efflux pump